MRSDNVALCDSPKSSRAAIARGAYPAASGDRVLYYSVRQGPLVLDLVASPGRSPAGAFVLGLAVPTEPGARSSYVCRMGAAWGRIGTLASATRRLQVARAAT